MKKVWEKNYFLLALAIVYCIIALIQFSIDGILETKLYFSIAFISLDTTLFECLKSSTKWLRTLKHQRVEIDVEFQNNAKRHIDILGKYSDFSELVAPYQSLCDGTQQNTNVSSKNRWDKTLDLFESVIHFAEIFLILSIGLITPLKEIPNNLQTAKIIDILSLLSVAFAFFSIYINESMAKSIEESQARRRDFFRASNYYLDIIEKISTVEEVPTVEDNEGEK